MSSFFDYHDSFQPALSRRSAATADAICFEFESHVPLADAEMSLHLALFATEGIFGRARVRLDADYELAEEDHAIVVDAGTEVGAMVVRVFTGLLLREWGEDVFRAQRRDRNRTPSTPERTLTT